MSNQIIPVPTGLQRVKVSRGFFALRQNQFGVCNPDDVVDINANDAKMLRSAGKCEFVGAEVAPKLQADYLPERKRDPKRGLSPAEKQVALLTDAVTALQEASKVQTKLLEQLLKDAGGKAK